MNKIYVAKFNAENYWKPENMVNLPAIKNKSLENIVHMMDELMFGLCEKESDCVLTSIPMNEVHCNYLHDLGFAFQNKAFSEYRNSMDSLEYDYHAADIVMPPVKSKSILSAYAVLSEYEAFAKKNKIDFKHPPIDVVQKVNSKLYSTELAKGLGFSKYAVIVRDENEFGEEGKKILQRHGGFIVKEEYGVSGKGNMKVTDERSFDALKRNIAMQCKKGKEVRFVLEPAFTVKQDFSVQYYLEETGHVKQISIQQVLNKNRAYNGSVTADQKLMEFLVGHRYFDVMEKLLGQLHKDGYYGDVCIDSMILEDDQLVPIVEINARKSMSLIKKNFEEKLQKMEVKFAESCMFSVDCIIHPKIHMEDVLERLKKKNILFSKQIQKGAFPLTSNTLLVNAKKETEKTQKGRMYFLLLGSKEEHLILKEQVKEVCKSFSEI